MQRGSGISKRSNGQPARVTFGRGGHRESFMISEGYQYRYGPPIGWRASLRAEINYGVRQNEDSKYLTGTFVYSKVCTAVTTGYKIKKIVAITTMKCTKYLIIWAP